MEAALPSVTVSQGSTAPSELAASSRASSRSLAVVLLPPAGNTGCSDRSVAVTEGDELLLSAVTVGMVGVLVATPTLAPLLTLVDRLGGAATTAAVLAVVCCSSPALERDGTSQGDDASMTYG